jgi:hypothetical protein
VSQILIEAVGQVQAIAQVYGLQVGARGPLQVSGLLRAIAQSVQRSFGHVIAFEADEEDLKEMRRISKGSGGNIREMK